VLVGRGEDECTIFLLMTEVVLLYGGEIILCVFSCRFVLQKSLDGRHGNIQSTHPPFDMLPN
jgi:hypothetical protein